MTLPAAAKMLVTLTFLCCAFLSLSDTVAAKTAPEKSPTPDPLELKRLDLEERKLTLERDKLTYQKEKDVGDFNLEQQKAWWTAISISLSISVPLILGLIAYGVQINLQRKSDTLQLKLKADNEDLQFKLKAAEIAMNSRDANEVKAKANMLKVLFKHELSEFNPDAFNPTDHPFSRSVEMRQSLISLLAENPDNQKEIIQAWGIVFPWDSDPDWKNKSEDEKRKHPWFVQLKKEYESKSTIKNPTNSTQS